MTTVSSMRHQGDADLSVSVSKATPEILFVPTSQIRTGPKGLRSGRKVVPERPGSTG